MLDIDLDFLNFLLNPTDEYLKKDIKFIENEYLKNSEIESFDEVRFLFLTSTDDLAYFLNDFTENLVVDVYSRFGKFFGLNLKNKIENNNNNFIISILKENRITNLNDDVFINILKNDIRNYLVDIVKNTSVEKERILARNSLRYLNELIMKFDNIINIINIIKPKYKTILDIFDKRIEVKRKIQRQIINEYSFLLTKEGKNTINNNDNYDVEELLEKEDRFNYYLDIRIKEKDPLKYNVFDIGNIISDYEKNLKTFLENKMKETEFKDYKKLLKDLDKYNELYKKETEDYILTISKEELKEKLYYLVKDRLRNYLSEYDYLSEEDIFSLLYDSILDNIINDHCYNSYNVRPKIMVLSPLDCVEIVDCKKIVCEFYHVLCHELGHVYDFYDNDSVSEKEEILDYRLLYEIYNDYISKKVINKIVMENYLNKDSVVYRNCDRSYTRHFFGLIDLFEEYDYVFKEWVEKDNIMFLKKLLGNRNFNKLINNIDNFDDNKFLSEEKYTNKLIESYDNILKQTKVRTKFKNIIN